MARRQAPRQPLLTAGGAWLLAALLLLAQGLGLVHGVAHGVALAPAHAAAPAAACDDAGLAHTHTHSHAQAAQPSFGFAAAHAHGGTHEAGDAQCRLIDQLAHADGLWAADAAPALPLAGGEAPTTALRLPLSDGGAAAYLARAPPRA
jgi:hypothetical protein